MYYVYIPRTSSPMRAVTRDSNHTTNTTNDTSNDSNFTTATTNSESRGSCIVHYGYMALAKKASVLGEAMPFVFEPRQVL